MYGNIQIATIQIQNDGRADFATNPFNGRPLPTYDQAQQLFCHVNPCLWLSGRSGAGTCTAGRIRAPVTLVADLRSASNDWSVTTSRSRPITSIRTSINEKQVQQNINLTYNQATGANNPFSNRALRAFPDVGRRVDELPPGPVELPRASDGADEAVPQPVAGIGDVHGVNAQEFRRVAAQRRHAGDVRRGRRIWATTTAWRSPISVHRLVFNGIWDVGCAFQLSGLYFFGSGERYETSYGGDLPRYRRRRQQPPAAGRFDRAAQQLRRRRGPPC